MKLFDQHDRGSVRIQVNIKICLTLGLFFGAESRRNILWAESSSIFLDKVDVNVNVVGK